MKKIILSVLLGLVARAEAASPQYHAIVLSTAAGTALENLSGVSYLAASSNTYQNATITLDGTTGGVNASSGTFKYFVSGGSASFAGSSGMNVLASGAVGIGTTFPVLPLDVAGNTAIGDTATGSSVLEIGANPTDDSTAYLRFLKSNANLNWQIAVNHFLAGGLEFVPSTVAGGNTFTTPAMVIDNSGHVGIGTTAPGATLEVNGDSYTRGGASIFGGADISQNAGELFYGGGVFEVVGRSAGGYVSTIYNATQHVFNVQGNEAGRFTPSGTFSIGPFISVANALDLNGNAAIGSYAGTNSAPSGGLIVSGNVGIGTASPGAPLDVSKVQSGAYTAINITNSASGGFSQLNLLAGGNVASLSWAPANFLSLTVPNSDPIIFNINGSQAAKISSGGNLEVNGKALIDSSLSVPSSSVTASAFFGDGSHLTGAVDTTKVAKAGDTMTGSLNLTNVPVTLTGVNGSVSAASVTASAFFGDGLHLTNLNAADLAQGTINDARLPVTMSAKTFSGLVTANAGVLSASSVTASALFGDGSHITGIANGTLSGGTPTAYAKWFASNAISTSFTSEVSSGVTVSSNFNVNGSAFAVSAANVGVGTLSPASYLDVLGANGPSVTSATDVLHVLGGNGGTGTSFTAPGDGSNTTITQGNGGAANSIGSNNGGNGGAFTLTSGTGGANNAASANGGNGGGISLKAGNGGVATTVNSGGAGGNISLTPGSGGVGSGGASTGPAGYVKIFGVITSSTPIPSVTCTTGSPTMTPGSGTNFGSYAAGALATGCTVTFATAFPNSRVFCQCQATAGLVVWASATSATSVTCSSLTAMTGDTITYMCQGQP